MMCSEQSGVSPEFRVFCCDDSYLQLRGLEINGQDCRQTGDGGLKKERDNTISSTAFCRGENQILTVQHLAYWFISL
jgi:hypothetical protein